MDNIIMKSRQGELHAKIEKVFVVFKENNMCLNLDNCAIGVKSGKFLGYMITHKGIEANP